MEATCALRSRQEVNVKMHLREIGTKAWISHVTQNSDKQWAVVTMVITFVFHKVWGVFLTGC